MRTSKLNCETLEAPDVPDVYRQRTCCADYQIGNNSGCFEALVAFWELLILEGYFSSSQKISAGETCVWKRAQLSCAEVMNVFLSNLDVKLDHRLLLRGGFYWFIILACNNGRRCYACIDSSLSLSLETSMWELRHCCAAAVLSLLLLWDFISSLPPSLSAPPFNPPCAKILCFMFRTILSYKSTKSSPFSWGWDLLKHAL